MLFVSSNIEWNGWIVCVCADKWLTDWLRTCVRACVSIYWPRSAHTIKCIVFHFLFIECARCACSAERNEEKWIGIASCPIHLVPIVYTEDDTHRTTHRPVCVRESVRSVSEWKWYFLILVFLCTHNIIQVHFGSTKQMLHGNGVECREREIWRSFYREKKIVVNEFNSLMGILTNRKNSRILVNAYWALTVLDIC